MAAGAPEATGQEMRYRYLKERTWRRKEAWKKVASGSRLRCFTHTQWLFSHFVYSCKFSGRSNYDCRVAKPNAFDLDWVYAVPCGGNRKECRSWICLCVPEDVATWGPTKKQWIKQRLTELEWYEVTNQANKRFQCPHCGSSGSYKV